MVGDDSDLDLLTAHRSTGSEVAFSSLTKRHVNLVFGAALRRTGCRELAEEGVQQVFILLARKGRQEMKLRSTLASWLYQAAINEGAHVLRTERRHRRRNARYMEEEAIYHEASSSSDRLELEVLDEALESLKPTERGAVLAHYYEGKTYVEIAAEIGKTPEACRKQCSRALDRLSLWLTSRARVTTQAGLSVALTALGTPQAPASLAAQVSGHALATAKVGASVGPWLMIAHVASVLIGVALPFAVMWPAVASRLVSPSMEVVALQEPTSLVPETRDTPKVALSDLGIDLHWLAGEFNKPRDGVEYPRSARLQMLMRTLKKEHLLAFAEICSAGQRDFEHGAWPSILVRWGELDPLGVLELFKFDQFIEKYRLDELRKGMASRPVQRIGHVLTGWAASDPDGLVNWCLQGNEKHQYFVEFHAQLVSVSPKHAIQLGQLLGAAGKLLVSGAVTTWAQRQPEIALEWISTEFNEEDAVSLAFIAGLGASQEFEASVIFANWLEALDREKGMEVLADGFLTRAFWDPHHAFERLAELPEAYRPGEVVQCLLAKNLQKKRSTRQDVLRAAMKAWHRWEPEDARRWQDEHGHAFGDTFVLDD